jgi:hypothetical protein
VTARTSIPSDADTRAFVYPLAALAQRVHWELDSKSRELARSIRLLHAAQRKVAHLQAGIDASTRHAATLLSTRPNPHAHQAHLEYLVQRNAALRDAQEYLGAAQHAHAEVQKQCAALHARHEGLARHREDALGKFVQETRHQLAGERDREWLARRFLNAAGATEPGESL